MKFFSLMVLMFAIGLNILKIKERLMGGTLRNQVAETIWLAV